MTLETLKTALTTLEKYGATNIRIHSFGFGSPYYQITADTLEGSVSIHIDEKDKIITKRTIEETP